MYAVSIACFSFGSTRRHEIVVRISASDDVSQGDCENVLQRHSQTMTMLSATAHGTQTEFTYGIRPKKDASSAELLSLLRKEKGVSDVDVFDAKHEVEF